MNQHDVLLGYNPNRLLDTLVEYLKLNGDKELAKRLGVAENILAKIRSGQLPVGASMLLWMNEISGLTVAELRGVLGDRRAKCRVSFV